MQTMKATKTRTIVSVALTVLAAGSILAGIYYVGNKNNMTGSAASACNVDYERIGQIFEDKISKVCGNSSGSGSATNSITGGCLLSGLQGFCNSGSVTLNYKTIEGKIVITCPVNTSEIWGKGCKTIKARTADTIISKHIDEKTGYIDKINWVDSCDDVAEDGYSCAATSSITYGNYCSCTKK
jgi:hypothetical protein